METNDQCKVYVFVGCADVLLSLLPQVPMVQGVGDLCLPIGFHSALGWETEPRMSPDVPFTLGKNLHKN